MDASSPSNETEKSNSTISGNTSAADKGAKPKQPIRYTFSNASAKPQAPQPSVVPHVESTQDVSVSASELGTALALNNQTASAVPRPKQRLKFMRIEIQPSTDVSQTAAPSESTAIRHPVQPNASPDTSFGGPDSVLSETSHCEHVSKDNAQSRPADLASTGSISDVTSFEHTSQLPIDSKLDLTMPESPDIEFDDALLAVRPARSTFGSFMDYLASGMSLVTQFTPRIGAQQGASAQAATSKGFESATTTVHPAHLPGNAGNSVTFPNSRRVSQATATNFINRSTTDHRQGEGSLHSRPTLDAHLLLRDQSALDSTSLDTTPANNSQSRRDSHPALFDSPQPAPITAVAVDNTEDMKASRHTAQDLSQFFTAAIATYLSSLSTTGEDPTLIQLIDAIATTNAAHSIGFTLYKSQLLAFDPVLPPALIQGLLDDFVSHSSKQLNAVLVQLISPVLEQFLEVWQRFRTSFKSVRVTYQSMMTNIAIDSASLQALCAATSGSNGVGRPASRRMATPNVGRATLQDGSNIPGASITQSSLNSSESQAILPLGHKTPVPNTTRANFDDFERTRASLSAAMETMTAVYTRWDKASGRQFHVRRLEWAAALGTVVFLWQYIAAAATLMIQLQCLNTAKVQGVFDARTAGTEVQVDSSSRPLIRLTSSQQLITQCVSEVSDMLLSTFQRDSQFIPVLDWYTNNRRGDRSATVVDELIQSISSSYSRDGSSNSKMYRQSTTLLNMCSGLNYCPLFDAVPMQSLPGTVLPFSLQKITLLLQPPKLDAPNQASLTDQNMFVAVMRVLASTFLHSAASSLRVTLVSLSRLMGQLRHDDASSFFHDITKSFQSIGHQTELSLRNCPSLPYYTFTLEKTVTQLGPAIALCTELGSTPIASQFNAANLGASPVFPMRQTDLVGSLPPLQIAADLLRRTIDEEIQSSSASLAPSHSALLGNKDSAHTQHGQHMTAAAVRRQRFHITVINSICRYCARLKQSGAKHQNAGDGDATLVIPPLAKTYSVLCLFPDLHIPISPKIPKVSSDGVQRWLSQDNASLLQGLVRSTVYSLCLAQAVWSSLTFTNLRDFYLFVVASDASEHHAQNLAFLTLLCAETVQPLTLTPTVDNHGTLDSHQTVTPVVLKGGDHPLKPAQNTRPHSDVIALYAPTTVFKFFDL